MTRRAKQISYGIFYLLCWISIVYVIYIATLKPPASCFDNRLNQDETEVDCGGAFCEPCAIRHLLPIKIAGMTVLPAGTSDSASVLVEMQNPNSNYGAVSFHYHLEFFGAADKFLYVVEGDSFIYPSEAKQTVLVNLQFAAPDFVRYVGTISAVDWKSVEMLSVPSVQTREVKLGLENGQTVITGVLRNNSVFPILSAAVNGFVQDASGRTISISRTSVQDLEPAEERFFQIAVPLPTGSDLSSLQPRVFVEAKR